MALVRGKIELNIEVKLHGHERRVAALVGDAIRREHFENACVVTSFGKEVVDEIKELAPKLQVGYIFGAREYRESVFTAPGDLLSVNHKLLTPAFIQKARAAHKQVHVWTVNDKPLRHRLLDLGVNGIITNYPDRMAVAMREQN